MRLSVQGVGHQLKLSSYRYTIRSRVRLSLSSSGLCQSHIPAWSSRRIPFPNFNWELLVRSQGYRLPLIHYYLLTLLTMRQTGIFSLFLSVLSFSVFSVHSIFIFSSPGAIPTTVPAACRAVLSQNITCEPSLVLANEVAQGRALGKETANLYCTPGCYKSLTTFKTNVATRCGNTPYKFYANSSLTQTGNQIADPFVWAYDVACLQDS